MIAYNFWKKTFLQKLPKTPSGLLYQSSQIQAMSFLPLASRNYTSLYRPKMNINFKDGRFHVYHSEGGEQVLKWLTRMNVLFMIGNTALLTAEMISPRKLMIILTPIF